MHGRTLHGAGKAKPGTHAAPPVPGSSVDSTTPARQEALKRVVLYSEGTVDSLTGAEEKLVDYIKVR